MRQRSPAQGASRPIQIVTLRAACRDWPLIYFLGKHHPEPPRSRDNCGRIFAGLIRVYLGIDPNDV